MNSPIRTTIPADLSAKLTVVSFVSACFVVVLHAYERALATGNTTTSWIVTLVGWALPTFAVSTFFAISGYLLGVKSENGSMEGWHSKALRTRARTLLVPYLAWCTIYLLTVVPFTVLGNHMAGRDLALNTHLRSPLLSLGNLARAYGGDMSGLPADSVLWYVRNLLLLVLIAPMLIWATSNRRRTCALLSLSGLAFLAYDWLPRPIWQFFETGFSMRGLFFFSLGLFLAANPVRPESFRQLRRILPFAWVGACLLFTAMRLLGNDGFPVFQKLLAKSTSFLGVGAVWVLYDFIPAAKRLAHRSFVRNSFFLYAAHIGIIQTVTCARVQDILAARLHIPAIGIFALRIAIPVLLSLTIAELLRRHCPRTYSLLTGGR